MNTYEMNFAQAMEKAVELANNNEEGRLIVISDSINVCCGREEGTYSEAMLKEYNISAFHARYIGGAIVTFPGDISFLELSLSRNNLGTKVINAVRDYLTGLGLLTCIDGNDLMLYSKEEDELFKVASYGSGWLSKGYMQTAIHISIGMDEELISKICTKPCQKKPRGLSHYGITTQDIYNAIKPTIEGITK